MGMASKGRAGMQSQILQAAKSQRVPTLLAKLYCPFRLPAKFECPGGPEH